MFLGLRPEHAGKGKRCLLLLNLCKIWVSIKGMDSTLPYIYPHKAGAIPGEVGDKKSDK